MSLPEDSTPPVDAPSTETKATTGAKGVALLAGGALILGAAVVGTVAYGKLSSSGDYPYMHMADGSFAYAQVNLDPSTNQKLAINKLTKKFPELKDEPDTYKALTSDNIAGELLKGEAGGDFSWVGDRLAVAAYPDADDDGVPEVSLLIETQADPVKGDLDKLRKTLGKATLRQVDVQGEDYLGYSTMAGEKAFPEDKTMADAKKFTNEFSDVRGNVLGAWIDMGAIPKDALGLAGSSAISPLGLGAGIDGSLVTTLEAHSDGLDFRMTTSGLEKNAIAQALSGGGAAKVGEVLSENSYSKPLGGIGVGNLGEVILSAAKQAGYEGDIGRELEPLDLNATDLPGLFGEVTSLSVASEDDSFAATLHGEAIDSEAWDKFEASGALDRLLNEETPEGYRLDVSRSGDTVDLTLGAQKPEGYKAPAGEVAGYLELDEIRKVLDAEDVIGGGLGKITFTQDTDDAGHGQTVIGWRITR